MTLLELLLALTIMASVMALLGAMMAQAHGWTERSAEDEQLMSLQRVGEALRTQWADRRSSVALDQNGNKVLTSSTELTFVTATGLLFPDWPLVEATYRIEADTAHVSSSGLLWRLVYVERRIAGMDDPPEDYALDSQGRSMTDSKVLLDGCAELRWERFGRAADAEKRAAEGDSSDTTDPTDGKDATGSGADAKNAPSDSSGGSPGRRGAPGDRAGTDRAAGSDTTVPKEDLQFTWRPMEADNAGFVSAMRLVGAQGGERFGWVFVIRALR